MNISDVIDAVKAVRKFAQEIEKTEVTKEDMESLATLSLHQSKKVLILWADGSEVKKHAELKNIHRFRCRYVGVR